MEAKRPFPHLKEEVTATSSSVENRKHSLESQDLVTVSSNSVSHSCHHICGGRQSSSQLLAYVKNYF